MYAALKDEVFQIVEVTDAYGISAHHIAKVVQSLVRFGYLESRRGRGGGLKLAHAADQIRLGKLLRQTEKHPFFVDCFEPGTNSCVISGHCRLKGILAEAINSFYSVMDQYTLRDLVAGPHQERMRRTLLPR
jgi:Rrf2 family nitric oxide-sensitive transcriptional repressor